MDLDKTVDFLNQHISENIGKSLNDSEIKLLQGSLKGLTYREIAENEKYSVIYLERQLGPNLWRNISKALGINVKKSNIRGVLEKELREQQSRFTGKLPSQEISQKEVVAGSTPVDVNTLVREVRSQYRQKIQDQCGTVRLLGIDKPIKINDPEHKGIYVDVYTIKDRPRQKWLETSDLDSGEVHQERELGLEVVARYTKLMVLGQPGFGKTTFLKYLAIQCNEGRFQPEKIPIFIELQRFAKKVRKLDKFSLINYVSQQIDRFISGQQIENMLSEGRFLILLDGLDEVKKDERNKVIEELDDFFESYNKNQFIITCRLEAQEYKFQNFSEVELAGFNPRQIEIFSQNGLARLTRL
jgi:predicted NACHT family NTPase